MNMGAFNFTKPYGDSTIMDVAFDWAANGAVVEPGRNNNSLAPVYQVPSYQSATNEGVNTASLLTSTITHSLSLATTMPYPALHNGVGGCDSFDRPKIKVPIKFSFYRWSPYRKVVTTSGDDCPFIYEAEFVTQGLTNCPTTGYNYVPNSLKVYPVDTATWPYPIDWGTGVVTPAG